MINFRQIFYSFLKIYFITLNENIKICIEKKYVCDIKPKHKSRVNSQILIKLVILKSIL